MPRNQRPATASAGAEADAARLRGARGRTAPVRSRRGDVDTDDHRAGQDIARNIPSTGKARVEAEGRVQVVDRVVDSEWAKNMKFNEDVLTIIVHDSTDPNADPVPYVINDGRRQAFARGEEQQVKRKYVEVLARMKVTTQKQVRYKDSQNIDAIKMVPHTALRFPFTVIADPSPRGKDWLKAVLAEPG